MDDPTGQGSNLILILIGTGATIATSVVTLLTLMFNARQTRLREERVRRETLEDRAAERLADLEDRAMAASTAATQSRSETQSIHDAIATSRRQQIAAVKEAGTTLGEAIAENTQKTEEGKAAAKEAVTVANNFNEKLIELGLKVKKHEDAAAAK